MDIFLKRHRYIVLSKKIYVQKPFGGFAIIERLCIEIQADIQQVQCLIFGSLIVKLRGKQNTLPLDTQKMTKDPDQRKVKILQIAKIPFNTVPDPIKIIAEIGGPLVGFPDQADMPFLPCSVHGERNVPDQGPGWDLAHRYRQIGHPVRGFDPVSVPPILLGILHVIVQDKHVHPVHLLEKPEPGQVSGL